ncbi:hypothetical protein B0H17DRAFT_1206922 [Mycena rosella]|uniref:Ribonuclease H1 N-terminal domain-containing protein n=1 Tax=Mycena rosella TaxID=1033263 RepID=A0AAD7D494_MYCRO|nr:hypothetical protein B0H17DRAFT_1206922 [Mycena rosella]
MSSSPPTKVSSPTPEFEVAALAAELKVIAKAAVEAQSTAATPQNVAQLVAELKIIAQAAVEAQSCLANVLIAGSFVPVPSFVAGIPPTPGELAAAIPADNEVQHYWVVLRGRQPGLYRTSAAAQEQTKGVPNQVIARKTGRAEALAFYAANYPDFVKKWIQLPAPVPAPDAPAATGSTAVDKTDAAPAVV